VIELWPRRGGLVLVVEASKERVDVEIFPEHGER
jgi:hypothetical protein